MRWLGVIFVFIAGLLTVPVQAQAGELGDLARDWGISELRAGVFIHDIDIYNGIPFALRYGAIDVGKWQNLNVEVLFDLPDEQMVRWLLSPRIGLSAMLNFVGKESYLRLAAVWHFPILETGVFIEPMLGGSFHNGYLFDAPADQRNLGCRSLYFYGANVGYEINERLSAMVSIEHTSHWAHCSRVENEGINRMGLKLGWKLN